MLKVQNTCIRPRLSFSIRRPRTKSGALQHVQYYSSQKASKARHVHRSDTRLENNEPTPTSTPTPAQAQIQAQYAKPSKNNDAKKDQSSGYNNGLVNSIFRKNMFIPSTNINNIVFDFKVAYRSLNTSSNISDTVQKIKEFVLQLHSEIKSDSKFQEVISKFHKTFLEILFTLDDDLFVDFFVFLCSKNIKLSDKQLTEKFANVLSSSNIELKNRLLRCSLAEPYVSLHSLKLPLTKDQATLILNTYSREIVKSIIISTYTPMGDHYKISEYLNILKLQYQNDVSEYTKFENFINLLFTNEKLEMNLNSKSSIVFISQTLASYLETSIEVPSSMVNRFHEIVISQCFHDSNSKILYNYIRTFVGNFPKEISTFRDYSEFPAIKGDLLNRLKPIVSRNPEIPMPILNLFIQRVLSEGDFTILSSLIEDLESLEETSNLSKNFRFMVLQAAIKNRRNKKLSSFLMDHLKGKPFILPDFEICDLKAVYEYNQNSYESLILFLKSLDSTCTSYKTVITNDVTDIFQSLNEFQQKYLMKVLISKKVLFDDRSIIFNYLKENKQDINYFIAGGNFTSLENGKSEFISLERASTLFSPQELFFMISDYGEHLSYSSLILSTFHAYKDTFEYVCAEFYLSPMLVSKTNSYMDILKLFLKNNSGLITTPEEKFLLYSMFIKKVLVSNPFLGILVASTLIPSYKEKLLTATGVSESLLHNWNHNDLSIKEQYDLPTDIVVLYAERYSKSKYLNEKLWVTLFKHMCVYGTELNDNTEKLKFCEFIFQYFQSVCIKNKYNLLTLYRIYQIAEKYGFNPEWKSKTNISDHLISYFKENKATGAVSVSEMLGIVSKYENDVELSAKLTSKCFDDVPDNDKMFFLFTLRNTVVNIPYTENIGSFIHTQFKKQNPDVYKLFGLDIENPLFSSVNSKRAKWMKFDVRYFAPLIEIFMRHVISKEANASIRFMMYDSIGFMNHNKECKACIDFYEIYYDTVLFDTNTSIERSNDLNKLFDSMKQTLKIESNSSLLPDYLYEPYMYHFIYTRMFSYELNTILKAFYVLSRGDEILSDIGYWDMIDQDEKIGLQADFGKLPEFYNQIDDTKLMNLYRLIFTTSKNSSNITTRELMNLVKISENLIKSDMISKKDKYTIMNCVFILVGKHSDLLSAFYKKMRLILPDYRVSSSITTDLLYSAMMNDLRDIDTMLDYLIEMNDTHTMHQLCERVIRKLFDEEHHGLAQELYVKYTERKPRFRIQELHDALSWGKAKQPSVTIDSNEGVNMKMDRYNVKLYDYDSLNKNKNSK